MLNVNADPKNAIMVSKEGMKTAMRIITMHVRMRMVHRNNPLVYPGRPMALDKGGTLLTSSPQRISMVTTIGRALESP
jgi:hypothetical protein